MVSGDQLAVICPRVADGAVRTLSNGHYLHVFGQTAAQSSRPPIQRPPVCGKHIVNGAAMQAQLERWIKPRQINALADHLGLGRDTLVRLGIGWYEALKSYTFPMYDAEGTIIGFRTRTPEGEKKAITGSRNGLFVPAGMASKSILFVCEGPTDAAAMLDLGFFVVGRADCKHGADLVRGFAARTNPSAIVVVSDSDEVGIVGANELAEALAGAAPDIRVIRPPAKDIRAWVIAGATALEVMGLVEQSEGVTA